jgi:hypothetical protein
MRTVPAVLIAATALWFVSGAALAQNQEDVPSGAPQTVVATPPPVSSPTLTPQQITERMVQTIERTPVLHGPNMKVLVVRETLKTKPTFIDTDCPGIDAAIAAGTIQPPATKIGKRIYGRHNVILRDCDVPSHVLLKLPLPKIGRQAYHRIKVRAMLRACHLVAKAAKKVQKPDKPYHVSCRHLKAVGSDATQTVLQYYGHGRSKKKILAIALVNDGRLLVRKRDLVTVDTYLNRQLQ